MQCFAVTINLDMTRPGERTGHQLVQEEIQAGMEERRISRMVGMQQKGAWTEWEQVMNRKIAWAELWKVKPHLIQFLI